MEVIDLTETPPRDGEHHGNHTIDLTTNETVYITIQGPPKALPRSRHFRNGFFNPARRQISLFKEMVRQQVPSTRTGVVFSFATPVQVTIKFFMKRPNTDFKRGERVPGMLRGMIPPVRPIRPDIDNLCKFILDGLNGVVYHDDRQVVNLVAYKLLDSEGLCGGRTVVEISEYHQIN